jgi:RNA polymerase sigma-70 factor (ECF subfamily)
MLYSFDYHATETNNTERSAAAPLAHSYTETDEQLIEQIQQGDEAALGILLYRHVGLCRKLIKRMLGDEAETENLVHEVFAEVSREAARYSEEAGPVLGWILTLARRRALDQLRKATVVNTRERRSAELQGEDRQVAA